MRENSTGASALTATPSPIPSRLPAPSRICSSSGSILPNLGYYDFPLCREAFCSGQKDARPEVVEGCHFRLRGRNYNQWTLLTFDTAEHGLALLLDFRTRGDKVQSLNYTAPSESLRPSQVRRGPLEWVSVDFPSLPRGTGKRAQMLRRALRSCSIADEVTSLATLKVFQEWLAWAKQRHFMVFTGHYLKWLELWRRNPERARLIGVEIGGKLEGIFGYEEHCGIYQVTIAKHTPRLPPKSLWAAGLSHIGKATVICGSTADDLKHQLGLTSRSSWMFKL